MVHQAEAAHSGSGTFVPVLGDVVVGLGGIARYGIIGDAAGMSGRHSYRVVMHHYFTDDAQGSSAPVRVVGLARQSIDDVGDFEHSLSSFSCLSQEWSSCSQTATPLL